MKLFSTVTLLLVLVGVSLAQVPNVAVPDPAAALLTTINNLVGGAAAPAVGTITALSALSAAIKAPLTAGYQVAREVLILIALIFFIKFLATSVDLDIKGLLEGKHEYEYDHSSSGYGHPSGYAKRSLTESMFDLPVVQRLAAQVNEAIEKYN